MPIDLLTCARHVEQLAPVLGKPTDAALFARRGSPRWAILCMASFHLLGCGEPAAPSVQPSPSPNIEPTPTSLPFTLTFRSRSGREVAPGVFEVDNTIVLDGNARIGTLSSSRAGSDTQSYPIGVFSAPLDAAELESIRVAATNLEHASLPPSMRHEGPTGAFFTFRFDSPTTSWERTIGQDPGHLEVFDSLIVPLNALHARLYDTPVRAIRLGLRREGERFFVRLENVGTVTVAVQDPRTLGQDDPLAWAGVRVAEVPPEVPGVTSPPLEWKQIPLQPPSSGSHERMSTIVFAGQEIEWPVASWETSSHRPHSARAVLSDYSGPDVVDGHPRIRGGLFSELLEFVP